MNDNKVEMKLLDAKERITNFEEVEIGYTLKEAQEEAKRCLHCARPRCMTGCPVKIRIPDFLLEIRKGNINKAYKIISESSSLPAICGRVCPQEEQCEKMCIRGIKGKCLAIGALERFVADNADGEKIKLKNIVKNGKRVAIVGSGPSGLTCAGDLAKKGYVVTIYEALHRPGGVLSYGIPEFRLPNNVVDAEIEKVRKLGVEIICDTIVGKTITIDELLKNNDAVYIADGASKPKFMNIKGEEAIGVYSANELLMRINLMDANDENHMTPLSKHKKAYIIGGGNVAMDAARTCRRLGMDVTVMYRRSEKEMPSLGDESKEAEEEGIKFEFLSNPLEILKTPNNRVRGMKCTKMQLGEEDESGRRSVSPIKGSEYEVTCDMAVMCLGANANSIATKEVKIDHDDKGRIITDETRTTKKHIYAGGDTVTGPRTVILAMSAGRKAAKAIDEDLFPEKYIKTDEN